MARAEYVRNGTAFMQINRPDACHTFVQSNHAMFIWFILILVPFVIISHAYWVARHRPPADECLFCLKIFISKYVVAIRFVRIHFSLCGTGKYRVE